MQSSKKAEEFSIPFRVKIQRLIVNLIKYPWRVAGRYNAYTASVGEMIVEGHMYNLDIYRKRYAKLVNIFIYLPMAVGVTISLTIIYLKQNQFFNFWNKLLAPISGTSIVNEIGIVKNRIVFLFTEFPWEASGFHYFLIGYCVSIFGAYVLNQNIAFKEEDRIREVLKTLNKVDQDDYPWRVTWTPEAIMITSFDCDPIKFTKDAKFWTSINFSPSPQPKILPKNTAKFIVEKKYELPRGLEFSFKDLSPEDLSSLNQSELDELSDQLEEGKSNGTSERS